MKTCFHPIIFIVLASVLTGFSGFGQFAFTLDSESSANGTCIASDQNGNIFVIGSFKKPTDFDPSSEVWEVETDKPTSSDIFLSSYDSNGQLRFAFRIGDDESNGTIPFEVTVDGTGNVYITGRFWGAVDFDPSEDVNELISHDASQDGFLASYTNKGELRFAYGLGWAALAGEPINIQTDRAGNVYISGIFYESIDFDPDEDIYELTVDDYESGYFIASYDTQGEIRWAYDLGREYSTLNLLTPFRLHVDGKGNNYIIGRFLGSVDFDPGADTLSITSSSNGKNTNVFVAKFDTQGGFVNVFKIEMNTNLKTIEDVYDVVTDSENNITIVGTTSSGDSDLDPAENNQYNITTKSVYGDIILASYTESGSLRYAFSLGNTEKTKYEDINMVLPTDIITDEKDNVYITGYFTGLIDFDPGPDEVILDNGYTTDDLKKTDLFVCSYNKRGEFRFLIPMISDEYGSIIVQNPRITAINSDYVCLTTGLKANIPFTQNPGMIDLANNSAQSNITIACFNTDPTLTPNSYSSFMTESVSIYPNPVSTKLAIQLGDVVGREVTARLVNLNGQSIFEKKVMEDFEIDISGYPKGYYILSVIDDDRISNHPVIIH